MSYYKRTQNGKRAIIDVIARIDPRAFVDAIPNAASVEVIKVGPGILQMTVRYDDHGIKDYFTIVAAKPASSLGYARLIESGQQTEFV